MSEIIRCRGCTNWWTGSSAHHCNSCHATFTTIGNFDKHRSGGYEEGRHCVDPATVGLVPAKRMWPNVWSAPGKDEDAESANV